MYYGWKKCLVQRSSKMEKIFIKCAQKGRGGAHLQYVKNHYAKFEYKVMNTVGVTDYTN